VSGQTVAAAIREALGLSAGAAGHEVLQRIRDLEEMKSRRGQTAKALVDRAIDGHRLWPSQRRWAEEYAIKDPEGFATYIGSAPLATPSAAEQLDEMARQRLADGLGYREALEAIAGERPDLVRRYEAERRRDDRMAVQFARTKGQ